MKRYVMRKYGRTLPTIDILDLLPNFQEEVFPYCFIDGACSILDMALLRGLCRQFKDCHCLDIGTWRGESVVNMASVAKKCHSIDIRNRRMFFGDNISFHILDSKKFDFSKIGKFDLIFIDGDHGYPDVKSDTENAFKLLKDETSVIVWHDYRYRLADFVSWPTYAAILDGTPPDKRKYLYHVSNTVSAIYTQRKTITPFVESINKVFKIEISAQKLDKEFPIGEVPWGIK